MDIFSFFVGFGVGIVAIYVFALVVTAINE
jgi:hypothetical protein